MLLDARGRLRFHNARADEWMADGMIVVRDGRLAFNDKRASAALRAALARMATRGAEPADAEDNADDGALLRDAATGAQLGVRFMRMLGGRNGAFGGDLLAIIVTPLQQTTVGPGEIGRFASLFGLSNAEQRIAVSIAAGESVEQFAASRKVKIDTARKQLKSTLMKTGSRSQKDLVRLIERYCFFNTR
jgi:DNA-binding CsgD family transcriptional regulator